MEKSEISQGKTPMLPESECVFIDTNILICSTFPDFDSAKHVQCLNSLI
jgi:hypothetical protein